MATSKKKDSSTTSLLMIIIGALLIILSYVYVFSPAMDKKKTYNEEVKELNNTISERENKVSQQTKYEEDTKNYEAAREKVLEYFPADIKAEDDLLFCKEIEDTLAFYFTSVGRFGNPIIFYADNASSLVGYNRVCEYDFSTSYESLKDMIDYVNYYKYRRSISAINASYENGALSGGMVVSLSLWM